MPSAVKKLAYELYCFLFADKMILKCKSLHTKPNRVNLHYWDSGVVNGPEFRHNLGDDLSTIIVSKMLARKGLSLDTFIPGHRKHLYAVGSIVGMGYQNATIWGSGFLEGLASWERVTHNSFLRKLDIRSVRGPLTRDALRKLGFDCPEVYGDPVVLMPLFYSPKESPINIDCIVIPHFRKEQEYRQIVGDDSVVSMVTDDYKSVIDKICSAKRVISSSLHGIILAESYGVPAIWLRDRGSVKDFKYLDYYNSTLRDSIHYASDLKSSLDMPPMPLPDNLDSLRKEVLNSFPYDLWERAEL